MADGAESHDVVVIGAGFGGLASALRLAELGARVCVLEQLDYPGGCASTFSRGGHRYEAGATLFSGFGPGQLFERWIRTHRMPVKVGFIDPLLEFRSPGFQLQVPRDRDAFVERFAGMPEAPAAQLRAFFAHQAAVAEAVWGLLDAPELLPPFGLRALITHLRRLPAYLPVLGCAGRSLASVMRRFGVDRFEPLRTFADALCQITVQCSAEQAEAPFALGTMDYYFRGTGHVEGGIGVLAEAMVEAIRGLGGQVRLTDRAKRLERTPSGWRIESRRGAHEAPAVLANLVPRAVEKLVGVPVPRLARRARAVADGWGAVMLYLVAEAPPEARSEAHHLEIVPDPGRPFVEGHHVFCSVSAASELDRAPPGHRTLTVSTHVPLERLRTEGDPGRYVAEVQDRMRRALADWAPEWWRGVKTELTASPRTFARFTGRPEGAVGGVPRRCGLAGYLDLRPVEPLPGLHLVGDSVFPGQSTLATALGGVKVAERVAKRLERRGTGRSR